ncbi:Ribonuclease BN, tRNA processing enzyme [Sanguibacter gelidistatuariae]|uniref:Ribonuclease BN, tRNA processing enzyme n=1 Tax=Sanguibacter gelidistatuariae TaxID=1814289 RepID=A0A1G6N1L2_9MICO|nr:MBL fold metallo-hydrolase [Sanguibacter gelidistatuariae]SDC61703.1 Ribonuclease BN, tRNA processing enzyme [Sanguibacter gelidistatuariae]
MKLTIVGMAGSFAGPASPASCYLVQADDPAGRTWSIVIDLGSGSLGALQQVVDPFAVDAVAISHMHPDHFADLCGYYVYLKYHPERGTVRDPSRTAVPVYCPAVAERRIAQSFGLPDDETMAGQFDFRTWTPGTPAQVGPFTIEPFAVEHPIPAYGLRVTGPSTVVPGTRVTLGYTGDTDLCDGVFALAQSADVLLAEAAFVEGRDEATGIHLTGLRAGQVAAKAGAARLLLTHIPAWNDPAVSAAEAATVYDGPVEVVEQGLTYVL